MYLRGSRRTAGCSLKHYDILTGRCAGKVSPILVAELIVPTLQFKLLKRE
jgi:hypothetical protein